MSTTLEFAVKLTCPCDANKVSERLQGLNGVEQVHVNRETQTVLVKSNLNADVILDRLNSTGLKSVLKGVTGTVAGVAILEGFRAQGVVRFMQLDGNNCVIDGTIDGLAPGEHQLAVHESGDLSKGCDSVGECYNIPDNTKDRPYGDLGLIKADANGRATFRLQDPTLKLTDVIGRSLVVASCDSRDRYGCGIIARSAGLFQNPKTVCACDGTTIWDETKKNNSVL